MVIYGGFALLDHSLLETHNLSLLIETKLLYMLCTYVFGFNIMTSRRHQITAIRIHQDVANDEYIILCNSRGPIKSGFKVIEGGGSESCQLFLRYVIAFAQRLTCDVIPGV